MLQQGYIGVPSLQLQMPSLLAGSTPMHQNLFPNIQPSQSDLRPHHPHPTDTLHSHAPQPQPQDSARRPSPPRSPLPAQRQRADQSTGEEGLSPGDSRETRDTDTSTDTGEDTTRTEASTEIRESTDDGRTTDTGTGTGGGTAGLRVAEGPGLEGAGRVGLDRGEEASRGRTSERIRTPR
jgi:hypothetical protein